jgi:hypothetical protein
MFTPIRIGLIANARATSVSHNQLEDLRAKARYARERYQLYKAKSYGSRPTSRARMRELQRIYEYAEAHLHAAEAEERRTTSADEGPPAS